MPLVSAIVPIYNVEAYLEACLESVLAQTAGDLEVVMVDDGSTDASAAIAERWAARDPRLRLLRQANAGLGAARNAGVAAARGELLSFVDSDDRLPLDAYARLHDALRRSGADFATGAVHRFTEVRTWPAPFLAKTFRRSRTRTHVTRFPWLLVDRMAQNKLWRRAFWERHALAFPEGVLHEDIPVVVPAHFRARAVSVVGRQPVYLYREREGGEASITQRRAELRTLRDRVAAVESVRRFLAEKGPPGARRLYDESVAAEDLRYHLDVLGEAGEEYRRAFLDFAAAFLGSADADVEARLPAIQRLKWHLVRRRALPELLEVLRFERTAFRGNPKVRIGLRVYGDYPFLGDSRLAVPLGVYRLDTGRRRVRHAVTLVRPSSV